jgi:AraC-like DNA-binding protein
MKIEGEGRHPVSAAYLVALQEIAAEKGIAPQDVLRGTGLPLSVLLRPQAKIGNTSLDRAFANVGEVTGYASLAVELGMRLTLVTHGILGVAIKNCATPRDAIELLVPYIRTRSGGQEELSFVMHETYGSTRWTTHRDDGPEVERFGAIVTLVSSETIGRWLSGTTNEHVDSEIRLPFKSPGEIRKDLLAPGLRITFEQPVAEWRVPRDWLEKPRPLAERTLVDAARIELEAELAQTWLDADIATIVRFKIRESQGPLSNIQEVADRLNMSTRTLQRKLVDVGTTFQKIKDSERFRRAIHLLETTDDSLEKIATALGYSDASNFSKAFNKWAGLLPGVYRVSFAQSPPGSLG